MHRRHFLAASAAAGLLPLPRFAFAQGAGRDRLRVMSEGAPNAFDSFSPGINRNAIQISWNVYDRLVGFAYKPGPDGIRIYDYYDLQPELAEGWEVAPDGRSLTFHLREATFHDGRPVTAEDVKFSLDRVVASPIGKSQFSTGSMTAAEQFVVLDPRTIRIDLPQPDRLALPNLALTYPIMVNAQLAKEHATAEDPFAAEWLKANTAGGGAYRIAEAKPGESILFERFDGWRSGPAPKIARVLWQTVPQVETRIAALKKGDVDVVQDLPARQAVALSQDASVKVAGVPTSAFQFIGMNSRIAPFDKVEVRQAIAAALPYEALFQAALLGRGRPLFSGATVAEGTEFPQPMGTRTDLARAKELLAAAGLPDGFETTFSFDLSLAGVAEPVAVILQEALAKVGIRVTIEKVPSGQLGTKLQEKSVPFFFEASIAFLRDPDYFFRVFCSGDTRWNFGSYANPEFDALLAKARYETDPAAYAAQVTEMIGMVKRDLPIILLWNPMMDVAMGQDVEGYSFAFHRMLDLRPLSKG